MIQTTGGPGFPDTLSEYEESGTTGQVAQAVFGQERRDGFVKARITYQEAMPGFHSKKDM